MAPRESHALAFMQLMGTERNDAVSRLDCTDD
jgi:hypothetical protein